LAAADRLQDNDARAFVLELLSAVHLFRGEIVDGRVTVERLRQIADRTGNPVLIVAAYRRVGNTLLSQGKLREAAALCVLDVSLQPDERWGARSCAPDRASARALMAYSLLIQGRVDRAYHEARASLEDLQYTDYEISRCGTLYYGMCKIATMIGDFAAAEAAISRLSGIATRLKTPFWLCTAHLLNGKPLVEKGEFAESVKMPRNAFDERERAGWHNI
jgi:ATP/maltotriose-dependent transcriptional regulator MalT